MSEEDLPPIWTPPIQEPEPQPEPPAPPVVVPDEPAEPIEPEPVPPIPAPPAMACYAIADAQGYVLSSGRCLPDMLTTIVATVPAGDMLYEISNACYDRLKLGEKMRFLNGVATAYVEPVDLDKLRQHAIERIDADAERARLRFISPGAGQMLEYQQTEMDAQGFLDSGGDIENYPFLKAEVDALDEAHGPANDQAVAQGIINQAQAWRQIGAEIKRLRRAAKMAVTNAATASEITNAANISWPEPSLA